MECSFCASVVMAGFVQCAFGFCNKGVMSFPSFSELAGKPARETNVGYKSSKLTGCLHTLHGFVTPGATIIIGT